MKKVLLIAAFAVFGLGISNAQETSFGVLGGFSIVSMDFDFGDFASGSDSETGFHIGAFADLGLSDQFSIQPELAYTMVKDLSFFNINVIAKYYVADGFNIQAGPQIGLAGGDLIDYWDDLSDDFSKMNLQLAIGVGYDFTEELFAQARYGFQLNNHYTGDVDDVHLKFNTISVSVGYKFM